ncbi:MAG: response regulator [Clostridia bacterium]|nr:response regulator [Clostridia bacterium]
MKKVMIVDDNYLSVEGITKNIDWNLLDAKVLHVAYNGDSAIEAMKKSPVDLIISDIEMPNLDGISMSSMALSINPLVKIILISAYDKFEYAKRAIRLGVCDYIEKPLDYEYLTRKIQNAFAAIDREQRNMELLEQSRPVMTEKFFIDLLNYSGSNARGHLKHYADYLNLNLEYNCFDVLKIEIENAATVESELGITQYQIELMNAMDLLQEKCLIFDSVYLVREFSGITCILGQNTKNTNHFIQVIHKTISTFFDIYKDSVLNMNVGIGTIVDDFWKLHISFESASHALKYRFFFPHQSIFDSREVLGQEFSLLSFTESREEELIRLLCQKNTEEIGPWLKDFFQELSQKCQTKNIMFIRIYSLLGRILKFLYELNIDASDLETKIISAYNRFDLFSTYEQFYLWMNDLCVLVCQKLDTSLNSYHDQLCKLVINYIQQNFEDNTLCLNDIAKHANVSSAYLSALYKKNAGQSISDTITACRIEKACYYLTQTNLSLKEISIKCGYANQYYFSNSFKKKMGMSPSSYRQM